MSLLNFFTQQRSHWRSQSTDKPSDYVAGGMAALDQAEIVFKATTLYNLQQQVTATQQELEEVSYELTQSRQIINKLRTSLNDMTYNANEVPKLHRRQARSARRALSKIAIVASHFTMLPEDKLQKVLEIVNRFTAANE